MPEIFHSGTRIFLLMNSIAGVRPGQGDPQAGGLAVSKREIRTRPVIYKFFSPLSLTLN